MDDSYFSIFPQIIASWGLFKHIMKKYLPTVTKQVVEDHLYCTLLFALGTLINKIFCRSNLLSFVENLLKKDDLGIIM